MQLDQCPHCGVRHVQAHTQAETVDGVRGHRRAWQVVRCGNVACQRLVLLLLFADVVELQYPAAPQEIDAGLPVSEEIRSDFREASLCLSVGCYKASLVMSRRVLQRMLAEQGCKQRNLVDAIKAATDNGVLRRAFHPLAEEIRHYGNLGAHPDDDLAGVATKANAEQVLQFAALLVDEFYRVPAAAAALRTARTSQ
jgi:hypothetical protein